MVMWEVGTGGKRMICAWDVDDGGGEEMVML